MRFQHRDAPADNETDVVVDELVHRVVREGDGAEVLLEESQVRRVHVDRPAPKPQFGPTELEGPLNGHGSAGQVGDGEPAIVCARHPPPCANLNLSVVRRATNTRLEEALGDI